MHISLKNILLSSKTRKICACIIGYFFWYTLSANYSCTRTIHIPLKFYNGQKTTVQAPSSIIATISGPRTIIKNLNTTTMQAHIDAQKIPAGKSNLEITPEELRLHKDLRLVNYTITPVKRIVENPNA